MNIHECIKYDGEQKTYDYAMCMLLLQNDAHLTFMEARAALMPNWEPLNQMSKEYGITLEDVFNLQLSADEKIAKTGKTLEEICGKYALPTMFISPDC